MASFNIYSKIGILHNSITVCISLRANSTRQFLFLKAIFWFFLHFIFRTYGMSAIEITFLINTLYNKYTTYTIHNYKVLFEYGKCTNCSSICICNSLFEYIWRNYSSPNISISLSDQKQPPSDLCSARYTSFLNLPIYNKVFIKTVKVFWVLCRNKLKKEDFLCNFQIVIQI